jgi:hypothetical protein
MMLDGDVYCKAVTVLISEELSARSGHMTSFASQGQELDHVFTMILPVERIGFANVGNGGCRQASPRPSESFD